MSALLSDYSNPEVFWSRVDRTPACWLWTGSLQEGYGRLKLVGGKVARAHRVSYELENGPIAEGMVIDHLCRNRACVNPSHLEAVSDRVNIQRGTLGYHNRAKCKYGHDVSQPEQVYTDRKGWRNCRECRRIWRKEWRERNEETTLELPRWASL